MDGSLAEKKEGRRRTSGFRMADAKALTRALAKGTKRAGCFALLPLRASWGHRQGHFALL